MATYTALGVEVGTQGTKKPRKAREAPSVTRAAAWAALNDLVWKRGSNFLEHADADAWLAEHGLSRTDCTPKALAAADKAARHRLESLLQWEPPLVEDWENGQATHHIWRTRDRRYRIARSDNPANPCFMSFASIDKPGSSETLIAGGLRSLRAALEAVEAWHKNITKREDIETNAAEMLGAAEIDGLHVRPRVNTITTSPVTTTANEEEVPMAAATATAETLYVSEKEARELLVAMGKADKTTPISRLAKKFERIEKTLDGANEVEGDQKALLKRIMAARADGNDVVVGEKPAAKPSSKKGGAKAAAKPSANGKSTKASSNGDGRDSYGSRLGSDCAKVNALLSDEPQTEGDLRKKVGVRSSVEYHLDKLVRLGILKWKEGQGYSLKK
jgi:hypothetical protein